MTVVTRASPRRDEVLLVDSQDHPVGVADKLAAHEGGGQLHRAFSIFLFDASGRMLLQKRSLKKYHFGGLWTNACCGHPRMGEDVAEAAWVRLGEELGVDVPLEQKFTFEYKAHDARSGLTEHELDHVLFGSFEGAPTPNPDEVDAWRWVEAEALVADVADNAGAYTPWFRLVLERVVLARSAADAGAHG